MMGLLVFYIAALISILICVVLNVFLFLKINTALHRKKFYGFFIQRLFIHGKECGRDGDILHFFPISIIIRLFKKTKYDEKFHVPASFDELLNMAVPSKKK
jgi:hypothetical protein